MKTTAFPILVLACFIVSGVAAAQTVEFENNWGSPGFNVVSQSSSGLEIVYSAGRVHFGEITVDGETMATVGLPGVFMPNNPGAPNLPGVSRFIAFPRGARFSFEITAERTETFENVKVVPASPIPYENDDSPPVYEKDPAIYGTDAFYPESPVSLSEPMKMRGVDTFVLGVTPFAYNPVSEKLVVYTDLRIKVAFHGGSGHMGDDAFRSRWFEPMLEQNLLNYSSLPAVDFSARTLSRSEECEYMIFVPDDNDFLTWADTIKDFRVKQGVSTTVFNISDYGGTASGIENKINDAYANWTTKPVAVLMLGDVPAMPALSWGSYCLSDNMLADIDGDDLPELNIARITARDAADLTLMINKFIDYETTPPTNPSFYDEPVIAGGWQTERWFILTCEIVKGFLENVEGKHPVDEYAIYSGSPGSVWSTNQNTYMLVDYFGPNPPGLGYIPATPGHLNDWGGNATRLNADINSGAFWLLHRDHGYEEGWGEPAYHVSDLANLTNSDLVFVLSINCCTGEYGYSPECFAEVFHRMQYGALGVIAASGISYSFVNDTFVLGMHDSMWPHFDPGYGGSTGDNMLMPSFAMAYGKWYLAASSWPYNPSNKDETYHLFHHQGDAFTQVYSEVPQSLTVSHASTIDNTATSFDVTADAGSLIALSAHGEVLGTAVGTGSPVSVQIAPPGNPGFMYVTVTEPNYYRYEGQVVIQTGGPLAVWPPNGTPTSVLPGPETEVDVMIVDGVEQYVPGTGMVHYRFDPLDPYTAIPLTSQGGDLYLATIPGARPDSLPEFYFSAQGDGGSTVYSPSGAPATVYSYTLEGLPEVLMHDNFETDTGWTVQNQNLSTGAWERCDPNPTSGQQVAPLNDNPSGTGTLCYVTENGPSGAYYADHDIDGGPTRLISPAIDLSSGDAMIKCYAWYYSRDGNDPFKIDVSNNNGTSWTNVFSTNNSLGGWSSHSFLVSDYVTPTASVRVRYSAQDQPNDDIVEAGLDDFSVERINMNPSIWASTYSFSGSAGADFDLLLDAGTAYAGREYAVVGGMSGGYPGYTLPGGNVLPVNFDAVTTIIINNMNSAMLQNFRANLDGEGEGTATVNSFGPINPLYIGETLTFAFTLTVSYDFVSNPVAIEIVP